MPGKGGAPQGMATDLPFYFRPQRRLYFRALCTSIPVLRSGDKTMSEFSVIIEKDEDGYFVASVPSLRGCHTQAKSLDTLMKRIKEAIELCLEVEKPISNEFIGVQKVAINP
jgi:predicted RNase H-like HicB family nuclease